MTPPAPVAASAAIAASAANDHPRSRIIAEPKTWTVEATIRIVVGIVKRVVVAAVIAAIVRRRSNGTLAWLDASLIVLLADRLEIASGTIRRDVDVVDGAECQYSFGLNFGSVRPRSHHAD